MHSYWCKSSPISQVICWSLSQANLLSNIASDFTAKLGNRFWEAHAKPTKLGVKGILNSILWFLIACMCLKSHFLMIIDVDLVFGYTGNFAETSISIDPHLRITVIWKPTLGTWGYHQAKLSYFVHVIRLKLIFGNHWIRMLHKHLRHRPGTVENVLKWGPQCP